MTGRAEGVGRSLPLRGTRCASPPAFPPLLIVAPLIRNGVDASLGNGVDASLNVALLIAVAGRVIVIVAGLAAIPATGALRVRRRRV